MKEILSQEEKIDYIFNRLKKQEATEKRNFIFKWFFRIIIFGYIYYLIMVALPDMIAGMIPEMPNFEGASIENAREKINNYFSND